MTGKEIFRRYGSIIHVISIGINILPRPIKQFFFNLFRNIDGILGYFLRYIFAKGLLKSCGNNIRIGTNVIIEGIENLCIGNNVSINPNCFIIASGGITIGDNVSIAHATSIVSESHTWEDINIPISYNPIISTPIVINNDVWIACGVRIIGPCTINSRVIVAAGAVIKGTLLSGIIYGGIPAKPIKKIPVENSLEAN